MESQIHPTAVIHTHAELHPTVVVGPYAVIGADVRIGPRTQVGAHVVIEGPTEIGADNHFFPGAAIGLDPQDLKYQGAPSRLRIGDGNRFREYVTVNRATTAEEETRIGNQNLLMAYSHVAHNCVLADNIIIANSVALAGHVQIESRVVIGGVLGIHQFVHVGEMAMLGGMSRIDRDVPPYMLVEGNPARVRALNLIGLKRAGLSSAKLHLLKKAFRLLYRSDQTFTQGVEQLATWSDQTHLGHLYRFLRTSLESQSRRGLVPGSR
ncbi:MAG: acyl-ACP--UDP-N-acetylglucosamine O-acyltransferase [Cyanobacteria bacterium P01_G01_bin.54]